MELPKLTPGKRFSLPRPVGSADSLLLAQLAELYPALFGEVLRPLKRGIFQDLLDAQPEVLECHMVAGGFDYLIKARVGDMDAYRVFLGDVLVKMPGVRETRTYAVMEEVKNTTHIKLD